MSEIRPTAEQSACQSPNVARDNDRIGTNSAPQSIWLARIDVNGRSVPAIAFCVVVLGGLGFLSAMLATVLGSLAR